ncbi:MAG: hypothetical protein WBA16_02285 [Nonlabens sp.]
MRLYFLFFLFTLAITAQEEQTAGLSTNCENLLAKKMGFLIDGSLTDESIIREQLKNLKPCGLEEYDMQFFGRMEMLSGILHNQTKVKPLEQITYGDWLADMIKIKQTQGYLKVREMTEASDALGTKQALLATWNQDVLIFQKLGASERIKDQVYRYLKDDPTPGKTYREVLTIIKKTN